MAEKSKKNVHEVKIEIKGAEWKKKIDEAYQKVSKDVKVDGFRPGKVPRDIFEKKFGTQSIIYEAIESNIDEAFKKASKEFKEEPIMMPSVGIEKGDEESVIYVFTFTTKPEIKIKKYKNLGVKKEDTKVTKKEIDEEIEKLKKEYADLQVKNGKAENGDTVIIDFEGFDGDKAFEGGKGENYALELGSGSFIPGFEDQLIGAKAGDDKEVKVSFPKDYHAKELQGKPVVFKVKVHEVKTKVEPELNEEFFLDLGLDNVKTIDELKNTIKETMEAQKEYDAENKYIDALFEELLKNVEVEVPHELIHEELDRMIHDYEDRLKMQGVTLEQFYKFTNSSEDKLKAEMHPEAEKRVKLRFAIDEIIEKEKIDATEDEVKKEAEEKSKKHNMKPEEYIEAAGGMEMLKYDAKVRKVVELLK